MASRQELLFLQKEQPANDSDKCSELKLTKDEILRLAQKRREMRKKIIYNSDVNFKRTVTIDNKLLDSHLKMEVDCLTRLEAREKRKNDLFIHSESFF